MKEIKNNGGMFTFYRTKDFTITPITVKRYSEKCVWFERGGYKTRMGSNSQYWETYSAAKNYLLGVIDYNLLLLKRKIEKLRTAKRQIKSIKKEDICTQKK